MVKKSKWVTRYKKYPEFEDDTEYYELGKLQDGEERYKLNKQTKDFEVCSRIRVIQFIELPKIMKFEEMEQYMNKLIGNQK